MRPLVISCALLALVLSELAAPPALAQVFSPGPMSKSHASLEGLTTCTKCHVEAGKHDNTRCIACHAEIGSRQDAGVGFHARFKQQFCAECHKEHKGTSRSLIDWSGPSPRSFNHSLSGWPLVGSHKKPDCIKCHDNRRIVADDVRALVKKTERTSFLGLPKACVRCHFDEHRDQEGERCEKCHTPESTFKKASLFSHTRDAAFALTGKHRAVACDKCHTEIVDEKFNAEAFPAPRAKSFLQLNDIPHAQCVSCHEDVHRGQFGKSCTQCHSTEGWKVIKQTAQDFGFHDKTDFPLRGEHTSVGCKSCHGPFPGERAVFKGVKHARCADCHADAHEAQLKNDDGDAPKCDRCHDVAGFLPVKYDAAMHASARFALEGSHKVVACTLCHKSDARLPKKVPSAVRQRLEKRKRPVLASATRLALPEATERCETCHRDPHAGQFDERIKGKGCNGCHQASSFAATIFDHDDSRFPLTGKHGETACTACHSVDENGKGATRDVIRYRPLETVCSACHADEHVGQLAKNDVTDCASCHRTAAFKPADFDHNDKQRSAFALEGKHKTVECNRCHARVAVGEKQIARYKPVATDCVGCHLDEHDGKFASFVVDVAPVTGASAAGCEACHTNDGWAPARFAHERTGFPLRGKHVDVACADCHGSDTERPVPTSCAGCHQDPHAQEFGLQCRSCHDERGFQRPPFVVDAHRRTNFPLSGRHAVLPCDECHVGKREHTFDRAALDCAACHAKDARAASSRTLDHSRPPFSTSCRGCHEPLAFVPARLPDHESCFPIASGVHASVRCDTCHTKLAGVRFSGACGDAGVRCAECHTHNKDAEARHHKKVAGYEYQSARCAGCHRSGK